MGFAMECLQSVRSSAIFASVSETFVRTLICLVFVRHVNGGVFAIFSTIVAHGLDCYQNPATCSSTTIQYSMNDCGC